MRKLCVLVLCAPLLTGAARAEEVPELLESVGVELDTATVERGDLNYLTLYEGQVVCETEELWFEVDGRIASVDVLYGQQVEKGDVLATLDETDAIEEAERLERELTYLRESNALANRILETDIQIAKTQLRSLTDDDAIESLRQQIEDLTMQLEQQKELQEVDEEVLRLSWESAKSKLGKNTIVSPVSGRVVYVADCQPGDYVQAYTTLLCVADESRPYLSSQYISQVTTGGARNMYALIGDRKYSLTMVPADMNENIKKSLLGIELTSNFTIDDPDEYVHIGDYAAVCFVTREMKDVLYVPANAVYTDAQGKYVYRMEDGVRVRQNVSVSTGNSIYTLITEGLEEGDQVYVKE